MKHWQRFALTLIVIAALFGISAAFALGPEWLALAMMVALGSAFLLFVVWEATA